jgi:hypothetical protein
MIIPTCCIIPVTHKVWFGILAVPVVRSLAYRRYPAQDTSGRARIFDVATGLFELRDQCMRDGQSQRLRGHMQGVRVHAVGIAR